MMLTYLAETAPGDFKGPCLPYICKDSGTHLPKIPSVKDVILGAVKYFVELFTGSASDNLKRVLSAVTSTPVADLRSSSFTAFYGTLYGFTLILTLLAMLYGMAKVVMNNGREDTHASILLGGAKIFFAGAFMPAIISGLQYIAQGFTKEWLSKFDQHYWQGALSGNTSSGDVISDLLLSIASFFIRLLLVLELVPIAMGVYLFVSLAIVAMVTLVTKKEISTLCRWLLSATLTGILLQPVIVMILTSGGVLIADHTVPGGTRDICVLLLMLLTLALPVILFWANNKVIKTQVEKHLARIKGDVSIQDDVNVSEMRKDEQRIIDAQMPNASPSQTTAADGKSMMLREQLSAEPKGAAFAGPSSPFANGEMAAGGTSLAGTEAGAGLGAGSTGTAATATAGVETSGAAGAGAVGGPVGVALVVGSTVAYQYVHKHSEETQERNRHGG